MACSAAAVELLQQVLPIPATRFPPVPSGPRPDRVRRTRAHVADVDAAAAAPLHCGIWGRAAGRALLVRLTLSACARTTRLQFMSAAEGEGACAARELGDSKSSSAGRTGGGLTAADSQKKKGSKYHSVGVEDTQTRDLEAWQKLASRSVRARAYAARLLARTDIHRPSARSDFLLQSFEPSARVLHRRSPAPPSPRHHTLSRACSLQRFAPPLPPSPPPPA